MLLGIATGWPAHPQTKLQPHPRSNAALCRLCVATAYTPKQTKPTNSPRHPQDFSTVWPRCGGNVQKNVEKANRSSTSLCACHSGRKALWLTGRPVQPTTRDAQSVGAIRNPCGHIKRMLNRQPYTTKQFSVKLEQKRFNSYPCALSPKNPKQSQHKRSRIKEQSHPVHLRAHP